MKLYIAVMKYISLKITSGISVLPYPLMISSHILFFRYLIYMFLKTIKKNLYDYSDMISVKICYFTKCWWSIFKIFWNIHHYFCHCNRRTVDFFPGICLMICRCGIYIYAHHSELFVTLGWFCMHVALGYLWPYMNERVYKYIFLHVQLILMVKFGTKIIHHL